jgi:hypothetical protein
MLGPGEFAAASDGVQSSANPAKVRISSASGCEEAGFMK